jgi:hypothetical protein
MKRAAFFQPGIGVPFDEALNETFIELINRLAVADQPTDGQVERGMPVLSWSSGTRSK